MRMGTRASLLIVVAVAAIPAVALMGYDFVREYRLATDDARDELARFVNIAATANRSIIAGSEAVLASLLERASVVSHDNATCSSEFAKLLARTNGDRNFGIIESDGTLSCSGIPFAPGSINLSNRDYFQQAMASRKIAIGTYQVGRATKAPSINLALAGQRPDGTTIVAFRAIDLDRLGDTIFRHIGAEPHMQMVLTDRAGTVLASWPETSHQAGKSLAGTALFSAMVRHQNAIVEIKAPDNATTDLAAVASIAVGGATGFFLAATQPVSAVTAEILSFFGFEIVVFAVVVILAASLAWIIAERLIRRPLARLTKIADDLGTGKSGARVGSADGTHEINSLAVAFDRMASSLVERNIRLVETNADLRRAHDTLNALFDASPSAIICINPDKTVTLWNRSAERIFGWKSSEILGQPYPAVANEERQKFMEYLEQASRGNSIIDGTGTGITRDGKRIDLSLSTAPLYDENNQVTNVVFVINDITRRIKTRRELQQAQKMEAVGQLTGGLAHDFNNLLAVVIGNLDLVCQSLKVGSREREDIQAALDAALRGAELTKNLLAFSRQQPLHPKRIDVNNLVANLVAILARTLGEDITVETRLVDTPWPVVADPSQIESALMNMAVNARDAMPAGGRLIIETDNRILDADYASLNPEAVAGNYLMLSVSDSGVGIPPDILPKVFDPFFTTKPAGAGSGLGLSMIYGFVKQSGGHIKIYSEPGVGTTVRIYLPKAKASEEIESEVEQEAGGPEPVGCGTIVLVVEDKADVRKVVCRHLIDLGYKVLDVENATAALDVLRSTQPIDLLFTDVVMPGGISGPELAWEAQKIRSGLKVLFASGFPEAMRSGGNFAATGLLISKPYRRQELAKKLREVLGGT